jgi:hypothetical protein
MSESFPYCGITQNSVPVGFSSAEGYTAVVYSPVTHGSDGPSPVSDTPSGGVPDDTSNPDSGSWLDRPVNVEQARMYLAPGESEYDKVVRRHKGAPGGQHATDYQTPAPAPRRAPTPAKAATGSPELTSPPPPPDSDVSPPDVGEGSLAGNARAVEAYRDAYQAIGSAPGFRPGARRNRSLDWAREWSAATTAGAAATRATMKQVDRLLDPDKLVGMRQADRFDAQVDALLARNPFQIQALDVYLGRIQGLISMAGHQYGLMYDMLGNPASTLPILANATLHQIVARTEELAESVPEALSGVFNPVQVFLEAADREEQIRADAQWEQAHGDTRRAAELRRHVGAAEVNTWMAAMDAVSGVEGLTHTTMRFGALTRSGLRRLAGAGRLAAGPDAVTFRGPRPSAPVGPSEPARLRAPEQTAVTGSADYHARPAPVASDELAEPSVSAETAGQRNGSSPPTGGTDGTGGSGGGRRRRRRRSSRLSPALDPVRYNPDIYDATGRPIGIASRRDLLINRDLATLESRYTSAAVAVKKRELVAVEAATAADGTVPTTTWADQRLNQLRPWYTAEEIKIVLSEQLNYPNRTYMHNVKVLGIVDEHGTMLLPVKEIDELANLPSTRIFDAVGLEASGAGLIGDPLEAKSLHELLNSYGYDEGVLAGTQTPSRSNGVKVPARDFVALEPDMNAILQGRLAKQHQVEAIIRAKASQLQTSSDRPRRIRLQGTATDGRRYTVDIDPQNLRPSTPITYGQGRN